MDNTQLFTDKAKIYQNARPSYPRSLMKFLEENFNFKDAQVADIGAGTGKFTELLLDLDAYVTAVEPNDAMVTLLKDSLEDPKLTVVERPAEDTELETDQYDIITVAQAFHWFDPVKFKKEAKRILKPDGNVFLIWNSRKKDVPVNIATQQVFERYCPLFEGFSGGKNSEEVVIDAFFDGQFERQTFDYPFDYCKEGFVNRCLSASYALSNTDPLYPKFVKELEVVFDKYSKDNQLIVPNETYVYYGRLK
ncbi:class I SAM-dependent methyltransferase [Macrococcus sp. DPC7161]|uniref:class I SAM-dependent methyltransferase n=1 Tax=Macrococcus sp. DPC7161 TaxID=2507060 RepID=UPI00100BA1BC|nr:class I SAM-dependent methyltransferase [Macrococcus sp. DPC7161]RXK17271.1 class I SAM-dependent methyltransferase [Macrococcus sp. DPC7161]